MIDGAAIAVRLGEVRERIASAAQRSGRRPDDVRLVLASKTQPPEAIAAAYAAGARDFGENYVQEGVTKRAELSNFCNLDEARWHLIGNLQSNKARAAVAAFDIIQTVDRASLASALCRIRAEPPMPVLIEVNIAGETSKSGVNPDAAEALLEAVRGQVDARGLMTVPPPSADDTDTHQWFGALRELRDRLARSTGLALGELSMGMTADYEVAIAEGATIVRIGRAIFGDRMPRK
jgi:pyridoxal phosphate enzyme (YggS family)